jgi:hypothetical protein
MDKKILAGIVDAIVKGVMEKTGLDEAMARSLVGIGLKNGTAAIIEQIAAPHVKTLTAAA